MGWKSAADLKTLRVKAFFAGPSGSGKTRLASTFPTPLFFVPANERSYETLSGMDIPYYVLGEEDPFSVMDELTGELQRMVAKARKDEEAFYDAYGETVVLESLSHYQDLAITQIRSRGKSKNNYKVFGAFREHMLNVRDLLFQLPCHIVMTSLDDLKTDQEGHVTDHGPMISGASKKLVPSSCNLLAFCEQRASVPPSWVTHVCQYKNFPGRSRIPGFPNGSYENFSYEDLRPFVEGSEE